MAKRIFKEGDLVEYIETFYNNIHKIHRGVIVKRHISGLVPTNHNVAKYEVITTEGKSTILWADELVLLEETK